MNTTTISFDEFEEINTWKYNFWTAVILYPGFSFSNCWKFILVERKIHLLQFSQKHVSQDWIITACYSEKHHIVIS